MHEDAGARRVTLPAMFQHDARRTVYILQLGFDPGTCEANCPIAIAAIGGL